MKHMFNIRKKIIVISLLFMFIVLVFRYGFVIILWMTTPKKNELSINELKLINEIKKELDVKTIDRTPRYNLTNPKDTISYSLFIKDIDCVNHKYNLKKTAQKIAQKINKNVFLHKKVYKIDIVYECSKYPPSSINYKFFRDSLK